MGEAILTPAEAAQLSHAHENTVALVLADLSDNPGDGAYGDATDVLSALMSDGGENILLGALYDPVAVAMVAQARVGASLELSLGGHSVPEYGGAPPVVTAQVRALSDGNFICDGPMWNRVVHSFGAAVILQVSGVISLKSFKHLRTAYAPYAARIALVDGGGLASPRSGA